MPKLTEDISKGILQRSGLKVPQGAVANNYAEAYSIAEKIGKPTVIKALIPTGRRGKANAIRFAYTPQEAEDITNDLLGMNVYGYQVNKVWVEEKLDIKNEYFISISVGDDIHPLIVVSVDGGVDIETITKTKLVKYKVPYLRGLPEYDSIDIWEKAGADPSLLVSLGEITSKLYQTFVNNDLLMLEVNPLAITKNDEVTVAAAMASIDDEALYRHPDLDVQYGENRFWRPLNQRELDVIKANLTEKGASVRYTEIEDGEIGLCIAGGGAGLMQHDLVLKYGGKPACHTDLGPGPNNRKIVAVMKAILSNPNVRSLLVGINVLQIGRADHIASALIEVIKDLNIDPRRFPIVVRLSGMEEEAAKKILSDVPGIIHYSYDVSLEEAVKKIVELTEMAKASEYVI